MDVLAWIRDQFSEGRLDGLKARRACPEVSKSETFKARVAEGHIIAPEYRPKVDPV